MNRQLIPILLAGLLCLSAIPATAQDENEMRSEQYYPVSKSSLEGGRYEIVVPTRNEFPSLFRLDKYTGDVWELPNDLLIPHKLILFTREPDENDLVEEGKVNYQLIAVSSSHLYLINLNTGILWEYSHDLFSRKGNVFRLIEERY